MKHRLAALVLALAAVGFPAVAAAAPAAAKPPVKPVKDPAMSFNLWPGQAPGKVAAAPETLQPSRGDGIDRLTNVSVPQLHYWPAPAGARPNPAVVVCPGGGYGILAWTHEGKEIAEWLNGLGISVFVLKYRVPDNRAGALQDVQRAVSLVRARAAEFQLDPARIGVLGFSAGGHLCARASTAWPQRQYEPVDAADQASCRPDFAVLVYPAYLVADENTLRLHDELPVNAETPKTFLVQTQDDGIKVENSLAYYLALRRAKVPAELHLFPVGGHGYGLRPSANAVSGWPQLAARWLQTSGIVPAPAKQ